MTGLVLTENFYTAAFLVREANGYLSRDPGTMTNATGADVQYQGGLVVSLAGGGAVTAAAAGTNAGNGAIAALADAGATPSGVYTVRITKTDGSLELIDPSGELAGVGTVGAPFVGGEGLGFTVTAGGTAFAVGDTFMVTIGPNPGAYVPYTGAAPAAAILFNHTWVTAGATRKVTVISRLAEVNHGEVQWDPSVTAAANSAALMANAKAQLTAEGIVFR